MTVRLVTEADAAQVNCALRNLQSQINEVARAAGSASAPVVNITDLARQVAAFIGSSAPPAGSIGQITFGVPPVSLGSVLTEGSSLSPARADHVHTGFGLGCYLGSTTSVPDNTETPMQYTTETFDDDGMHDNVTNNTRITFVHAGTYIIGGYCNFEANVTGHRTVRVRIYNSDTSLHTIVVAQSVMAVTSVAAPTRLEANGIFRVTAGQYAEVSALHLAGAPLSVTSNGWAYRLGI